MSYKIVFTRAIRRQIAKLPGHIKAIAKQRIAGLSDEPRPPRSKELEQGIPVIIACGWERAIASSGTYWTRNRWWRSSTSVPNRLIYTIGWGFLVRQ